MLLVDERPEEVTDMRRNVNGEVIASSLDQDVESHVRISQLVVERCRRLAEMGKDVFLLMDSITRLARAFNKWVGNTGRTMSGGVDIKAMDIPKKLFATARVFEEGGSLTIVGTALIDTGSRMDELIFQEFKGTGNMELVLDRKLADRRVWPAIDITQSGTRREELLHDPETLHAVTMLRRTLTTMHHVDAMEQLTRQLGEVQEQRRVHQADQRRPRAGLMPGGDLASSRVKWRRSYASEGVARRDEEAALAWCRAALGRGSRGVGRPTWLRRQDQPAVAVWLLIAACGIAGSWIVVEVCGWLGLRSTGFPRSNTVCGIDINRADWPELTLLPGISRTMARRIVQDRRERGPFRASEDLQRSPRDRSQDGGATASLSEARRDGGRTVGGDSGSGIPTRQGGPP